MVCYLGLVDASTCRYLRTHTYDLCESLSREGLAKLELPKPVQLDSKVGSTGAWSCDTMQIMLFEDVLL